MIIELDGEGNVLNTYPDGDPDAVGEWYPSDTVIRQETEDGRPRRTGPPRISRFQPTGWPDRAAREWNDTTLRWESTGGATEETNLEKAIRLLRNNPVPDAPADLPASPTQAQVVQQVRDLTTQVQTHQRYTEGYRKLLLRILKAIQREHIHG